MQNIKIPKKPEYRLVTPLGTILWNGKSYDVHYSPFETVEIVEQQGRVYALKNGYFELTETFGV